MDVSSVVKLWQHAKEAETADRAPTNEFDQSVSGIGVRRDEHVAAGVFAVVEGEEEAAALVPILIVVAAKCESAAAKLRNSNKHAEERSEVAERLAVAIGQSGNISGESHTS